MEWNWHLAVNVFWLIIIVSFVGWLFVRSFQNSESPGLLIFKWGLTVPIVIFLWREIGPMLPQGGAQTIAGMLIATVCMVIIALLWRGSLIESVVKPFTAIFDGGNEPPEKRPFYSIAQTRRNRGKPHEAVVEIRRQLAMFPDDFEGVLLLARIQAEDLADLSGAEITVNHFCDRPEAPLKLVVAGLTQVADWHMKIAADVDSARAALQKIVTRFPDTEAALQAEQRLAHLGETEKIILAQHDRQAVAVPAGVNNIGLLDSTAFLKPAEIDPGKLAAAHVKHLEAHPHDTGVREKLAVLYAKDFKRLDLATMELAQLINEPKHKPKQLAHWLNLLANFQIELGADVATVRSTLEKIVESFPDLPVAEVAQRRLARLNSEFKGRQDASGVKLGVYEQNIGLKHGRPGGAGA